MRLTDVTPSGVFTQNVTVRGLGPGGQVAYKNINALTAGPTNYTIFTPPAAMVVQSMSITVTSFTGSGNAGTGSLGVTGAGYTDIVNATSLTGLTAVNLSQALTVVSPRTVVAAGTAIVYQQSVAATSTTCVIEVQISGFYI